MEDALRVLRDFSMKVIRICLNPCSNGRCSARRLNPDCLEKLLKVLILVLMEDALREVKGATTMQVDAKS